MKLTPLQTIIFIVILAGITWGTYCATIDQLPDLTGVVVGNTTNPPGTNQIGTVYISDKDNAKNTSVIITNNTKIYRETKDNKQIETDMKLLRKGSKVEIYTIGEATNTIPPQIEAEKIIIKQ